jgi:hypothetical protein
MSAVAVAWYAYPDIHELVSIWQQSAFLPHWTSRSNREALQECVDHLREDFQAAIRVRDPHDTPGQQDVGPLSSRTWA